MRVTGGVFFSFVALPVVSVLIQAGVCRMRLASNMREELASEGIAVDVAMNAPHSVPSMCEEAFRRV